MYLQIAALGSALISGFWSLLGRPFWSVRSQKAIRTKVVAAGTFGGMIGGLLAERVGTTMGVTAMLPVLAALDLLCAFLTRELSDGDRSRVLYEIGLRHSIPREFVLCSMNVTFAISPCLSC